jgi:hypothetical protein
VKNTGTAERDGVVHRARGKGRSFGWKKLRNSLSRFIKTRREPLGHAWKERQSRSSAGTWIGAGLRVARWVLECLPGSSVESDRGAGHAPVTVRLVDWCDEGGRASLQPLRSGGVGSCSWLMKCETSPTATGQAVDAVSNTHRSRPRHRREDELKTLPPISNSTSNKARSSNP